MVIYKKEINLADLAGQIPREMLAEATPLDQGDYEYDDERIVVDGRGNILDGFHRAAGIQNAAEPDADGEIDTEIEVIVCEDERLAGYAAGPERPEIQQAALLIIHEAAAHERAVMDAARELRGRIE